MKSASKYLLNFSSIYSPDVLKLFDLPPHLPKKKNKKEKSKGLSTLITLMEISIL